MDSKPLNLFEMMSPNPPIAGTPITSHPNLRPNPGSDTPSRINHPEYPQPDQQQKPNPPTDPTTVDPSLPPPPQTSTVVESFNELKKFHWDKLSPEEFQQLHDLASYCNNNIRSVIAELCEDGILPDCQADEQIGYSGFKLLMDTYLEVDTPDELCRHLFLSFIKRPKKSSSTTPTDAAIPQNGCSNPPPAEGGTTLIQEMAVSSTTTAAAAITPLSAGSLTNLVTTNSVQLNDSATVEKRHNLLVDRLNELPEKYHHRRDSQLHLDLEMMESSPIKSGADADTPGEDESGALTPIDIDTATIPIKDVICYLSLMEGARPEDKLEFMFHLYDADGNGVLDTQEMVAIVNQMMKVADYLGWDVTELRPILTDLMVEIDYDSNGYVTLVEWKRGGLTNIPLLVLLGLDQNVKEDGNHLWDLKHFNRPIYCNLCLEMLASGGVGKKGLCCVPHERCVQKAPTNCITTYVKSKKEQVSPTSMASEVMTHHWTPGNCAGKCSKCKKPMRIFNGAAGQHCRWCQMTVHDECKSLVKLECSLGELKCHIVPPTAIYPVVLDRQRSFTREGRSISGLSRGSDNGGESSSSQAGGSGDPPAPSGDGPLSFQITPPEGTRPLLVFINPKSGGQQGPRLFRKFQYLLNPRQVYDISCGGPSKALQMFKDVNNLRVLCCGGDGTVGWLLDSMDKIKYQTQPPVGVLPLGTGNDLARCLKWGGGYEGESLKKVLKKIERSNSVMMDRWEISLSDVAPTETEPQGDPMPYNIINNYFSVGVDAAICVKFHLEREKNPHKFNSRMRNKMWYFEASIFVIFFVPWSLKGRMFTVFIFFPTVRDD
ncbi:Diacylglycerol kinase 1 [Folsomia candida]|uniref:Diacylglycerol kinase n=1 Tax=Folsomia candida TaxID=158441 RepID=A0A226E633_FOLCA|nr:Diacylglycerol kinase 1 [Folsomia candida]